MSQQVINRGAAANDGSGDSLRLTAEKINDNFTELYAAVDFLKTDVPSAATCNIGAAATSDVRITGSVSITSFGSVPNKRKYVYFSGSPTITPSSSLILPGGEVLQATPTSAGLFVSDAAGVWRCHSWVSNLLGFGSGFARFKGGEIRNQDGSAFYSFYNSAGTQRNGYIQITETDAVIVQQNDKPLRFFRNNTEHARFAETTGYFGLFNNNPQYPFDVTGLGNFSQRVLSKGVASQLNVDYYPSPTAGTNVANGTYDAFGITCVFPSGKIVRIYRRGNTHVDDPGTENDFGIIVSDYTLDGGKTYSAATTVRSVANEDLRNIGGGVTPSGRCVLAFYRYNADTGLGANALMTSDDEGVTWGTPTEITVGVANSPYGGLIAIGDGKVALPMYGGGTGLLVISSDDFRTWGSAIPIGSASPTRTETSVVYLGGSTLLALGRVEAGSGNVSFRQHKSTNNGTTWTDQGATTFDDWSYASGHPPWLQRFRGPDGQLRVVCYYMDRDVGALKAVYANALELIASGVTAWDSNNKVTIASGMIAGGSGYPAVIHLYDNPVGIGCYYNETVTDDVTQIVTLITPTTFPTTVGGPFGGGVTQPKAAAHFAPLSQLSAVPAAGTIDLNVGLLLSQPDGAYGLIAGSLNNGKGFIQAQRNSGGATTYNLQLQPNGGAVEVGDTIELGHLTDTTLGRISAGVAGVEGVPILTTAVLDADGTLAGNSDTRVATQKATKTYVDQIIAAQDAMVFKGVIDCSANPNYPAADRGHTYRVSVAGKIGGASGTNVEAGDIVICLTDGTASGNQAAVGTSWSISQANLDGAVIGPSSATDSHFAQFDGTTGKLIKGGLALDTDGTLAANSATRVPSQSAVKTYAQPLDSDLTTIAAIAPANDDIIQRKAGAWTNRNMAQLMSDLAALGTTFQPLDSDITSWAGVARASGFDTFAATPSSANLRSLLTDETGTGSAVFGTSPTIATPNISSPVFTGTLQLNDSAGVLGFYNTAGSTRTGYFQAHSTAGFYFVMELAQSMFFYTSNALRLTLDAAGANAAFTVPVKLPGVAFASLPAAATAGAGAIMPITDSAAAPVKGAAAAGGGSLYTLVLSNGTTWLNA